ncbi:CBN-MECR-1 protein, partial [Aphelenchoides avenae]
MSQPVKRVIYEGYGDPEKVLSLEETRVDSSKLGGSEVLVRWLAAPVNPSDLAQIGGSYASKPSGFPAVGGNEGVGIVEKVGSAVTNLKSGDYVFPAQSAVGTWRTHGIHDSSQLFPFPRKDLSLTTLATLLVNPPTAYLLLKNYAELKKGDVIVQNGANSAVGKYVIQ